MKKLSIKKTKAKKKTLNGNKRNYSYSSCHHDNCPFNPCRSKHCNASRREWNNNASTKSSK